MGFCWAGEGFPLRRGAEVLGTSWSLTQGRCPERVGTKVDTCTQHPSFQPRVPAAFWKELPGKDSWTPVLKTYHTGAWVKMADSGARAMSPRQASTSQ